MEPKKVRKGAANAELHRWIVAAGREVGLFLNEVKKLKAERDEGETGSLPAEPITFTLRPVAEYARHFRGSWSHMSLEAVSIGELGNDERGIGLIIEAHFRLAYAEGFSSDDPGLIIDDILDRIVDFAESHPDEAAILFRDPLQWEMSIDGEIIYDLDEGDPPVLDFGMYPDVRLAVLAFEAADRAGFEQMLETVGDDDSPASQAIQQTVQRLALLLRWLDMETPSRPPLLDLLGL